LSEAIIEDVKTLPVLQPRIAFRDVARATDSRTVIVGLVPPQVGLNNKAPYLLFPNNSFRDQAFVLGIMSSLAFDWVARRHVEVSLNFFVLNSLPVPLVDVDSALRREVEITAGRLAASDKSFAGWAKAVGVEVGSVKSESDRLRLICELDALVAKLFGLDEADLSVIFETFHVGWDYRERLDAVLGHFRKL